LGTLLLSQFSEFTQFRKITKKKQFCQEPRRFFYVY